MWKVAIPLILALVFIPLACFYFDDPLSMLQLKTLSTLTWIYGSASILCFIISTVTKNYSQVDKLWSTIPILYVWVVAFAAHFDQRIVMMAGLVTVWGVRLTYNFGRRGGYKWKFWEGDEDYRWEILQAKPGFEQPWKWVLFNFIFISAYQMGLILLMTLPIVKAMGSDQSIGIFDYFLSALFILFVIIEYLADEQQFQYQQEKHRLQKEGKALSEYYKLGFTHTGLWAYMRHPNYMAEQAVWIVFYGFSVAATGHWINWSIGGALLLLLLFKGSSDFSEEISASKYPHYARYQKEVARFLPLGKKFKL